MSKEFTKDTLEKAEVAKRYIEKKYSGFVKDEKEKAEYLRLIEDKMTRSKFSKKQITQIKSSLVEFETIVSRLKRRKIKIEQYHQLCVIGKGSFGEVRLCRHKQSQQLVAIKRLSKKSMVQRKQISHVSLQKQLLLSSQTNYIIDLKSCFQDSQNLYFSMEFLPGGDLMTFLIREDILSQESCRFYMVQIVLAVEYLHKLGYIHRDLKPDNILIAADGHIKLIDFGLVKFNGYETIIRQQSQAQLRKIQKVIQVDERIRRYHKRVYSRVGTPEYIAPEVLCHSSYDHGVDWWSVGIIMYEMLFGFTPFSCDTPKAVCDKISNWKEHLEFPNDVSISIQARALLLGLICSQDKRFDSQKIKSHRFFKGIDWNIPSQLQPPFVPALSSPTDVSNFDEFPTGEPWTTSQPSRQKDYNFVDFDYKKPLDINVLEVIDNHIDKMQTRAPASTKNGRKSSSKRLQTSSNLLASKGERTSSPGTMWGNKGRGSSRKKKLDSYLMTEPN